MELKIKHKILLFSDWYEPGFKGGGPIRSAANFAKEMCKDYDIYIFTSDRDLDDAEPYANIEIDKWTLRENINVFYASPQWLGWNNIKKLICNIAPDFIYLNSMYSRYFTIYPLLLHSLGKISSQIILAPRGMLQEGAIQYKAAKKKLFLSMVRKMGTLKNVRAHATDEQEKRDIATYLPSITSTELIPNFSMSVPSYSPPVKKTNEVSLIFISRISPKKNLDFLLSLLNQINGQIQLQLTIRGSIESNIHWDECKTIIGQLPDNIDIHYHGPVENEKVCSLIQQHHLFVLPTHGENFGHAIFEALAAGRPVLISDQTPWRNLEQCYAGWDLSLDDPQAFVNIIERVAQMDNHSFEKWSRGAWEFAKRHSENERLKKSYRQLFS